MDTSSTTHLELFRYLRTLVDTVNQGRETYPKFALVEAYWHIGRIVVETEQAGTERADYGIHLIEQLSERLTVTFGPGYSLPNIWRFKQFYLAFPILSTNGRELPNLQQHLRIELCWSHYRTLMKLKNLQERAFYLNQAADQGWTVKLTQKLIRARYYFQTALGQDQLLENPKKISAAPPPLKEVATLSLRTRLASIKKTLLERHVGYAFVAQRQFISLDGKDNWIELVFFHIILQRFVLVQPGEVGPTSSAAMTRLLDAYFTKQPSAITKPPVGLVIDLQGRVNLHTASFETGLALEEQVLIPLVISYI
ncbi:PDDEXK nuclease domain-containing protein [Spirosoma pollinicola]|uniref:DUF1016 domain-containing protein n=1 Tax=Spirosoma pollinicola TaxID=2057025 RepID=A0A2K8Z8C6_9BACT|nr:PDDEXK nuclease domain-containing protein [Spirosoma pollinicola]AUD06104.1 hypothetical protein CWM47_32225 [Spirosoma pollinicola]